MANGLATAYVNRVPLSNHQAVAGVCRKALGAGYDAEQIGVALGALVDVGRSVTTDSLRIELDGPPTTRPRSTNAAILGRAMDRAQAAEAATA